VSVNEGSSPNELAAAERCVDEDLDLPGVCRAFYDRRAESPVVGLAILILVQIDPNLCLADRKAQPSGLQQSCIGIGGHRKMHEATSKVRPRLAPIEVLVRPRALAADDPRASSRARAIAVIFSRRPANQRPWSNGELLTESRARRPGPYAAA
jgi:hypothetical protein